MKYNKTEIMKDAWRTYRESQKWNGSHQSFAECLKLAWQVAKRDIAVEEETVRYFNTVCVEAIKKGEDAVYDAKRAYKDNVMPGESLVDCKAHMSAWVAAVAVFNGVRPTFRTELVNSAIMAEISNLEIA